MRNNNNVGVKPPWSLDAAEPGRAVKKTILLEWNFQAKSASTQ